MNPARGVPASGWHWAAPLLIAPLLLAGCSRPSTSAPSASPAGLGTSVATPASGSASIVSPGPTSTPARQPSAALVLSDYTSSPTYTVSLVGTDGQLLASTTASSPSITAYAYPPPVSESDTRVYYLDGNTTIRYLTPEDGSGVAAQVSGPPDSVVEFAVSPDDARVAVSIEAWGEGGSGTLTETSYIEDLRTGEVLLQLPTYSCSDVNGSGGGGPSLPACATQVPDPVGWHGDDVVYELVYGGPGQAAPSPQFQDPWGYELMDAATGAMGPILCPYEPGPDPVQFPDLAEGNSALPSAAGFFCGPGASGHWTDGRLVSWSGATAVDLGSGNCWEGPAASAEGAVAFEMSKVATADECAGGLAAITIVRQGQTKQMAAVDGAALGWLDEDHLVVAEMNQGGGYDLSGPTTLQILDIGTGQLSPALPSAGIYAGAVPCLLY